MQRSDIFHSNPEIMGGTPVFVGTRIPAKTLIDHLSAGDTLDDLLDGFPGVSRERAVAFLELAMAKVLGGVPTSEHV